MSNQDKKPRSYYVDYSRRGAYRGRAGPPAGGSGTNNARFKEVPDFGVGGQRGFLITSIDEVKSYMEMRHALEQYHHEIYADNSKPEEADANKKSEISTEDELEYELKNLRVNRPFKQLKTHCRNAIFLNIIKNFEHVDPIKLIDRFFDEMVEKRASRTSNTFKVLPVLDTFRNNVSCAKESITNVFKDRFLDEGNPKKYFIEFQSRGNYKLESEDKQKMVEGVAETVSKLRPDWQVSRDDVDYMIVLVALRNICCLSIVQKYFQRSKYNVIEFCKGFASSGQVSGCQQADAKDEEQKESQPDGERPVKTMDDVGA